MSCELGYNLRRRNFARGMPDDGRWSDVKTAEQIHQGYLQDGTECLAYFRLINIGEIS